MELLWESKSVCWPVYNEFICFCRSRGIFEAQNCFLTDLSEDQHPVVLIQNEKYQTS